MSADLFGELRALLHEPFDDEGWSIRRVRFTDKDPKANWLGRLRTLLRDVSTQYPEMYQQTWLPYLADFDEMWRKRTLSAQTFKALHEEVSWLPFAYYELYVNHRWSYLSDRDHDKTSTALAQLVGVNLSYSRCEDEGVKWLAKHEHLHNITYLGLHQCDLSPKSLRFLAEASGLDAVTGLHMSENHTGYWDDRLTPLIDTEFLARLEVLDLEKNTLHAEDLVPFVKSAAVQNLRSLDLSDNDLGDDGLETLADAPYLRQLESLRLSSVRAGDEGIRAIVCSPNLKRLKTLYLHGNTLGDAGAFAVANAPNLKNLEGLSLPGDLSDEAKEALRHSAYLSEALRQKFA